MSRSTANIQAEIDNIEAYLASDAALNSSMTADGVSISRAKRNELEARLDQLYQRLDRANGSAPMFVRGVVRGGMFS